MARRALIVLAVMLTFVVFGASTALACGGLIGPRGSVNLLRTTTLAAYYKGVEHYVTSFTFTGQGGGKFGSLVPLPGVPTKVERGGAWTLQRLQREVAPPVAESASDTRSFALGGAQVLQEVKIDALDITILKGGGPEVGVWAKDNGFELPPDAPEMLDYYADRSPIFMAARFNQKRAEQRGVQSGDGTPIHLTIPTPNPWVPLRILGLGKTAGEFISADVFLLTERAPSVLPAPDGLGARGVPSLRGMTLQRSELASDSLMSDLRSDKGMDWMPKRGLWLSFLSINSAAGDLKRDLAIDASGGGQPSWLAAGLTKPVGVSISPIIRPVTEEVFRPVFNPTPVPRRDAAPIAAAAVGALAAGVLLGRSVRRRTSDV